MRKLFEKNRHLYVICGILLLIIFYLSKCRKTPQPVIKTVTEQKQTVKTDSIASAKYKDSVIKIVSYWEGQAKHWEGNWNREVQDNAALQDTLGQWLNSSVPDTCEAYKQRAIQQYNKLVVSSKAKDNSCVQTINAKNNIIEQKDVLIKKGKEDYTKLRANLDTCFKNQTALEKYAKMIKPKHELSLIITGMSGINGNLNPAVGAGLGYRNKAGLEIYAAYYSNSLITIGIKNPLFKF